MTQRNTARLVLTLSAAALAGCSRVVAATSLALATGPAVVGAGSAEAATVGVPRIDATTKARLRALMARGAAHGLRGTVFAKVGDSITESQSFLGDVGHGWFELGAHGDLAATIAHFHRTTVDGDGNDSFAHASQSATAGWAAADALAGAPPPIARELDALRPAFALVMFGTNDLDRGTPEAFAADLALVVDACEARGVIAVLSTIPDRLDTPAAGARVQAFNARITALAAARRLPVMDLHAALASLPRHGLDADGIHPSAFVDHGDTRAAAFTPAALRYGYNARNLLALRTLARLRAVVLEDGAPDA